MSSSRVEATFAHRSTSGQHLGAGRQAEERGEVASGGPDGRQLEPARRTCGGWPTFETPDERFTVESITDRAFAAPPGQSARGCSVETDRMQLVRTSNRTPERAAS